MRSMRSVATCVNSCLLGYTVWIIKGRLWDLCQKRIIDSDKKMVVYILPECIAVGDRCQKQIDVCG